MATYSSKAVNNQIIIVVDVSIPRLEAVMPVRVKSLFDTGAQTTCISPKIIERLGLQDIGIGYFETASGAIIETLRYHVRLEIPIVLDIERRDGITQREVVSSGKGVTTLALTHSPSEYDLILGMDFISNFHITMWNNRFILSN